jgi:hypothetical protein
MKKSELKQIIKEEISKAFNEGLTTSLMSQYKGKTGPEGLIISKLLTLEKVLMQLKKAQSGNPDSNVTAESVVDMVLKTFNEIREI